METFAIHVYTHSFYVVALVLLLTWPDPSVSSNRSRQWAFYTMTLMSKKSTGMVQPAVEQCQSHANFHNASFYWSLMSLGFTLSSLEM